ncbi:uncharacterized protein LODBEIA_P53380 [Lodderomyces beijingensis]|uniref:Uncharacterized protein n=1 Tax=Lodderomyces beijingensis TaxID=1775926 RepID=A0ABP0ZSJ3_9ASCO
MMHQTKRRKPGESQVVSYSSKAAELHRHEDENGHENHGDAVVLEAHKGPVLAAKFNRDGSLLATGGMDRTIQLWAPSMDDENHEVQVNVASLQQHKKAVTSLAWLADVLVSASADATLGIWDTATDAPRKIRKLAGHSAVINQVASISDSTFCSVSDAGQLKVWDYRDKSPVAGIRTEFPLLTSCAHNGSIYISGIDPRISAFDMRKLDAPVWCVADQLDSVTSLSVSPDGSSLSSRSFDGLVWTYNITHASTMPRVVRNFQGAPSGKENWLIRTCFSNNNVNLLSGAEDHSVVVWDQLSGALVAKLSGHEGAVLDLDYHPTLDVTVSSSTDGTAIVREV